MTITGPRGTKDILPQMSQHWLHVENIARKVCSLFAYNEIRTPVFEHTELFLRGIGETTDIVEKEMYTFVDKGNRSITLRPENTASVVRSFLENKLYATPQPTKLYYLGPMFRYDRPQAGRYRQFHQFGVEAIGAIDPGIDAEVVSLALHFFRDLNLKNLKLYINSVGCPVCRPNYRNKLQDFLRDNLPHFCSDCQGRFERNPLRILDCKNTKCYEMSQGAPQISDCLCDECENHFSGFIKNLEVANVEFTLNPRLVRGLDYYTKTAFEIQYPPLGSQSAVCGGGRYDGLIEECGGTKMPAIGFAIGLERVLLALETQNLLPHSSTEIDIFFASIGTDAQRMAFNLLSSVRMEGFSGDMDYMQRSLKAQLKYANKYPARFVCIIGEDEIAQGKVVFKNMQSGEQVLIDSLQVIENLKKERKER